MKNFFYFFWIVLFGLYACQGNAQKNVDKEKIRKEIYLAGGCFWGTEHFFKQINGVRKTEVGYANGRTANPLYEQVCRNNTGHAETVRVIYDEEEVTLPLLLELYFKTIDPTSLNRQGGDVGTQYRTGIYYTDQVDRPVIEAEIAKLAKTYAKPIVIEVRPLKNFYKAEEYHQDYLDKNKNGYCHIAPELFVMAREANRKIKKYARPDEATLRRTLTEMQYNVTRKNGTEPPFRNAYFDEFREGIYVDIISGEPLFVSTDKFDSGCGWPAFSKPISKSLITENVDKSHGMTRVEVRSSKSDAHLGHVFTDGPADKGGLRYCINSASLRFIPKDRMKVEGYGSYLNLFDK